MPSNRLVAKPFAAQVLNTPEKLNEILSRIPAGRSKPRLLSVLTNLQRSCLPQLPACRLLLLRPVPPPVRAVPVLQGAWGCLRTLRALPCSWPAMPATVSGLVPGAMFWGGQRWGLPQWVARHLHYNSADMHMQN